MSTPLVKICGLTRAQDVEAAIAHGADFLGFIIACESPRAISIGDAVELARPASGLAKRVAVTVNATDDVLMQISTRMNPDFLQLHGDETPARVRAIKAVTGLDIIKAVPVRTQDDLKTVHEYEGLVEYILLDAKPSKNTAQRGGHGTAFDWTILQGFTPKTPYILAGGLNPANIKDALQNTDAKIFDVASGVEARAGVKDHALIAQLMKAIHT
ncbi:MAG: phosphoribosylanthranilate isomerase [Robiginitomaculum sp.]|nr:MAG: phosphoribosylanthranilate isomerase [Robiginitomaculum sp.]